jgi:hypothetical protein
MGDIVRNDAAHAPQWKQLCLAATLELDPWKLLERIVTARTAVLDLIENTFSKSSDGEQLALRDALDTLSILRQIAERDIDN